MFRQSVRSKKEFSRVRVALFLMVFLSPSFAYAADGGMVATFIANVCSLLSGKIAQGIGVLAIIGMGYRVIKGRMDWHYAAYITIGMGLILGAGYYGNTIFGGS